ncbi:MAG: transposase [Victivallaceae bacterium]|nr:transposase [Victivallaceae bacterium]
MTLCKKDKNKVGSDIFPHAGSAGRQTGIYSPHKGWYTRGYLPHYDQGGIHQAITYRLGDSIPQGILKDMQFELKNVAPEFMEIERRKKIEKCLDKGHGSCILKNIECAKVVENNWRHFDGMRYDLIAYAVMPNHTHILIKVYDGIGLAEIVRSWKNYSARRINEIIKNAGLATSAPGSLWQRGYWDRYIRDEKHFYQAIEYIRKNLNSGGVLKYAE